MMPIDRVGTNRGVEAQPIHVRCLAPGSFRFNREHGLIYLKLYSKKEYDELDTGK